MSLGAPDSPGIDPMEQAANTLTAKYGTLFVAAVGNDGDGPQTVASPASADAALGVGAVYRDDNVAEFSSRGPRPGDYALKPDLTAPGVGVDGPVAPGTTFDDGSGKTHDQASGTSKPWAGASKRSTPDSSTRTAGALLSLRIRRPSVRSSSRGFQMGLNS